MLSSATRDPVTGDLNGQDRFGSFLTVTTPHFRRSVYLRQRKDQGRLDGLVRYSAALGWT